MKLILVRHAQTQNNYEKRYQGKGSNTPLNQEGIIQATKTANYLKNKQIDIIISSPLKRTLQTAQIINKYHNKTIITDKNIIERDFGEIEGKKYKQIDYNKIKTENLYDKYKIETQENLKKRIKKFLNKLHENYPNKTILIISHGGTLKMLISILKQIPWEKGVYEIKKENSSISTIELDQNKQIKTMEIGNSEHLI